MNINIKSIIVSGIITGVIIMVIGAGLVPIIGGQMDEVLKNRLLPPLSKGAMFFFALNSIFLGIGVMGFYVLVKTVIKSKLKTIFMVSIIFWFFKYFLANASLVAYGFMPIGLTVIGTAWGLLELIPGVMIGSILYKSKEQ